MAGHGGGAWKVAYADFVTAMMAFFLVMWITAQDKAVKEAVATYFKDPLAVSSKSPGSTVPLPNNSDKENPSMRELHKGGRGRGRGAIDDQNKKVNDRKGASARKQSLLVLHDGSQTHAGTMITFPEDSAELDQNALERLEDLVPMLLGKPNKIEIRGHSSGRPHSPNGAHQDAWELSYARCTATLKFLEQKGVETRRFRLSQAGSFEPHTIRFDPDWQARNSRVEVFMLSEMAEDLLGTREERSTRVEDSKP